MATQGRTLKLTIIGDAKKAIAALDKTGSKLGKLGGAFKKAAKFAAIGGLAIGAAIAVIGPKVFAAAADLDLLLKKTKTVFGDQLPLVQKWAKANAAAMGLTASQAAGAAAALGDLLIPMKFNREQAAKMATDIVGLSGALSEWSGGQRSAKEVAEILGKAMLGERDSLKSLGISITEADIQARLLANGTKELTGELLQQAKAVATQELLFEKSTDAQAAFEKGGMSMARTQARLGAAFGEVKETILIGLFPAMSKIAEFLSTTAIPAFERLSVWLGVKIPEAAAKFGAWFEDNKAQIKAFLTEVGDKAQTMFGFFLSGIDTVRPAFEGFVRFLLDNKPVIIAALVAIGAAMVLALGPASLGVLAIVGLITMIGLLRDKWRDIGNAIIGFIESMVNHSIDGLNAMIGAVVSGINMLIKAFNSIARFLRLPTITLLKEGLGDIDPVSLGRIPGPGETAADRKVRDFVQSRRQFEEFTGSSAFPTSGGGAGPTVVINVEGVISDDTLEDVVMRGIESARDSGRLAPA